MRLAKLLLHRYGSFEDRELLFQKRNNRDLQIIFGPNEAGKSTTRRAVLDFLFGFPHHVSANWKTAASLLRVGAHIETNDTSQTAWRRRGRNNTLYDATDESPIEEDFLKKALNNLDRDEFEAAWALDHQRLREGGRQMVALKQDAGLQMLASELGTDRLAPVLDELAQTKENLWKKQGSKPLLSQRKAQLLERRKELAAQLVSPETLHKARTDLQQTEDEIAAVKKELTTVRTRLSKLERLGGVLGPYNRFREAEARLAERPASVFNSDDAQTVLQLVAETRQLEAALKEEDATLDGLRKHLTQLGPRATLLDDASQLGALQEKLPALEEDRRQAHVLENKLTALKTQGAALRTRLSLASDTLLPDSASLERLAPLEKEHAHLQSQQKAAEKAYQQEEAQLATLPAMPENATEDRTTLEALEHWLKTALPLQEAAQELESLTETEEEKTLQQQLVQLAPWVAPSAPLEALRQLLPPSQEDIQDTLDRHNRAEQAVAQAQREARQAQHETEQLAQKLEQLQLSGQGVTVEQISQARQERDAILECFISEKQEKSSGSLAQEARLKVQEADRLADRRQQEAETSALLEQTKYQLQNAQLTQKQKAQSLQAEQEALEALRAQWLQRLHQLCLPALLPAPFLSWQKRYTEVLAFGEHWETLRQHRQILRQRLASLCQQTSTLLEHPVCGFAETCLHIEKKLKTERQALETLRDQRTALTTAQQHLQKTRATLSQLKEEIAQLHNQWQQACTRENVPASLQPEDLPLLRQLVQLESEEQRETQTLHRFQHEETQFVQKEKELLARHNADSLTSLQRQVREAEEQDTTRQKLLGQYEGLQEKRSQQEHGLHSVKERLQHFTQRLPAPLLADLSELAAQAEEDLHTAQAHQRVDETRTHLMEAGQGEAFDSLCTQVATLNPDTLKADKAALEQQLDTLQKQHENCVRQRSEAQQVLHGLEGQDQSAAIATEIAQIEAEITELAENYVSLHVQQTLLQQLIARAREKAHGPLLEKAGRNFSRLTLGHYDGLCTEEKGDTLLLAGQRPGGTALVPADAMSEGTRDQLYLALRLAHTQMAVEKGIKLPFLADDLFITFDETRARAGLELLAELSEHTQILFFTHHAALREMGTELGHSLQL